AQKKSAGLLVVDSQKGKGQTPIADFNSKITKLLNDAKNDQTRFGSRDFIPAIYSKEDLDNPVGTAYVKFSIDGSEVFNRTTDAPIPSEDRVIAIWTTEAMVMNESTIPANSVVIYS